MISNENILKLETRRKIYNTILKYPGLHLRELSRRMNISFGTLRHHIAYLEKNNLIITKADHRYTGYYVSREVSQEDKELFNILRQKIPRKIILLMFCSWTGEKWKNKGLNKNCKELKTVDYRNQSTYPIAFSRKELIELAKYWKGPYAKLFHLNKHPTTLDFHLEKLLGAGLIERVCIGRETKYRLKDHEKIFTFLIVNNYELSMDDVNIWLLWSGIFSTKNFEGMEEIVFEICPHPYHA